RDDGVDGADDEARRRTAVIPIPEPLWLLLFEELAGEPGPDRFAPDQASRERASFTPTMSAVRSGQRAPLPLQPFCERRKSTCNTGRPMWEVSRPRRKTGA